MFEFQRYSQTDPRWKNIQLGFDAGSTIGYAGCLLTCMSMVATGFGHAETPETLNAKLKALGPGVGFYGASVAWGGLPKALPGMVLKKVGDYDNVPAPIAEIDAALAVGLPVIVEVDYSTAPGIQHHWIVLYGKKGNDYLLFDPALYPPDTKEVLLSQSRYAFAGPPEKTFTGAMWLEGPNKKLVSPVPGQPSSPPTGAPISSTTGRPSGIKVYTIEAELAMRSSPNVGVNNLIKRLPLFAELSSLETADQTRSKVGVVDHWLKVRDASGAEGFVAAWYLSTSKQAPTLPASGPSPSASSSASLLVRTTVPDVALRNQSALAGALIKRMPFNAKLTVLEPAADALRKVGIVNQWLNVRDSAGTDGYVAAWYVAAMPT